MVFNFIEWFIPFFNQVLVSLFILFFGLLFASIFERFSKFILKELRINDFLKKGLKFRINLEKWFSLSVYYIIALFSFYFSLDNLGIAWYFLIFWLGFIIIIFSFSFVLDIKDGFFNFYYGLKIKTKLKKGDFIRTNIVKGKLVKKNIFGIILFDDENYYVPNSFLYKGFVKK